jgi:predicted MFS family arabinose efflux permease
MAEQIVAAPKKLHYAWVVVGVTFVVMLVAAGMRATSAVMLVPWEEEFGWSRAVISFPIAVQLMMFGLVGPFSASFVERFGLRRTMTVCLVMMLIGMLSLPFITASWQLLPILGIFMGLAVGALAMVMAAIIANRWFFARRGMVMGLLSGATAAGQLIFIPSLAQMVAHFGWRTAVFSASTVLLIVIPLVWILMRDSPADLGLQPYGAKPGLAPVVAGPRVNPITAAFEALGIAAKHRDFWLLSGSFFVCGASTLGLVGTHFIPACLDHGIPETTAAGILGAMGVCNMIGTTASGWLSDRIDGRLLLCWFYASRGASLVFLPWALDINGPWGIALFGLFYGLDWIATVPPTVKLTTMAFGAKQSSIIYGWIIVIHQVGSAAAAYGAGLLRTYSGDYTSSFWISGALCAAAAIMVLNVGRKKPAAQRPVLAEAGA